MIYIERDFTLREPVDFKKNVQPKLNDKLIVECVYGDHMKNIVVGWTIKVLNK